MTDNFKSYLGADKLYYALVTQDDQAGFAADPPAYLAPLMNISVKPKTNSKTQYADNKAFDAMSAEGESESDVEITGLPLDKQAVILGKVWDSVNKRFYDNPSIPPQIALGYRALKSDGNYKYYWYLNCKFQPFDEEAASETDTPDPKSTKLKLTAIHSVHEFDLDGSLTKSVKRVVADDAIDEVDPDEWFGDVQVPAPGSLPSFTATPSPSDGATAQAVSVPINVVFSNPLAGGAERGVGLLDTDGNTAVTVTRAISSDRKTVTLAHDALDAATTYLLTLSGIRDMYGQALTDVAYSFETA